MAHRAAAVLVHNNHEETEHLLCYTVYHEYLLSSLCSLAKEVNDLHYKQKTKQTNNSNTEQNQCLN